MVLIVKSSDHYSLHTTHYWLDHFLCAAFDLNTYFSHTDSLIFLLQGLTLVKARILPDPQSLATLTTYQNNASKIFVLQKKAIRAINNLAYNEHTNAYFKSNKILKLSDQYKLQVLNYVFQVLHSNIDEEIKLSLLINNQIHSHNTRASNQMSILRVNRSKTKHCVLHNGMITWNSVPDIVKVNVSFSMFKSKVRNFYL